MFKFNAFSCNIGPDIETQRSLSWQNDRKRASSNASFFAFRAVPVSYTHLDVYKRQHMICTFFLWPLAFSSSLDAKDVFGIIL